MDIKLSQFKKSLLSPADIYWQKRSGNTVLISRKGEMLNTALLKKLEAADEKINIENSIDLEIPLHFEALFEKYNSELLIKDKMQWRMKILHQLKVEFLDKKRDQLQFDFLTWNLFSNIPLEIAQGFINRDASLFKRNLSLTTTYVWIAFLLGYYDTSFLKSHFSDSLTMLMKIGESLNVLSLKERLEYFRLCEKFNEAESLELSELLDKDDYFKLSCFERLDGSGLLGFNENELNDLEKVMSNLQRFFPYLDEFAAEGNTLLMLFAGKFQLDKRVEQVLLKINEKIRMLNPRDLRAG